jgi:HEAT repeats
MFHWKVLLILLLLSGTMEMWLQDATAHRELFTAQEKEQLKAAERIELEAVALTDQGAADASGIAATVTARFTSLGYRVAIDPTQSHDVTVKVKCEEHKVWEGTVTSGGDADQLDPASRLWKGPACQITYRIPQHGTDWRHEVRTGSGKNPTGIEAISQLTSRLADDPFPILLAGAWGQSPRLIKLLEAPATSQSQKLIIISLLGNMFAVDAIPTLSRTLKEKDPAVARSAALALGAIGQEECIPLLQELLKHDSPDLRLAAIKGLGRLAPLYPNSEIVPTLLAQLPREPLRTQTEIVRALGKTTDRRILEPLRAFNRSVQEKTRSDSSPELKELKQALGQSLDQFDGIHGDE